MTDRIKGGWRGKGTQVGSDRQNKGRVEREREGQIDRCEK